MADAQLITKPLDQLQEFVANASLQIDIGDLCYHDTDDAKPASSQADGGTEAINQRTFAALFAGVAVSSHQSSEGAGKVRIVPDIIIEMPCPSTTWEIGELVGASENSGGDGLLDHQVEKVATKDLAIGVCVKRGASLTRVWCRLTSKVAADLAGKAIAPSAALTTQLTSLTHTAPGTPDYAIQDLVDTGGFGFVTKDEGNTVLSVILNLQARLAQVETALEAHGLVIAN
jgi:hypothetical protein